MIDFTPVFQTYTGLFNRSFFPLRPEKNFPGVFGGGEEFNFSRCDFDFGGGGLLVRLDPVLFWWQEVNLVEFIALLISKAGVCLIFQIFCQPVFVVVWAMIAIRSLFSFLKMLTCQQSRHTPPPPHM